MHAFRPNLFNFWGFWNSWGISSTIWLLLCDQVRLHFSHIYFGCFWGVMSQFELVKPKFRIRLHCMFIYAAFQPLTELSNAQRVISSTIRNLPTTTGLNCFGHEIYVTKYCKIFESCSKNPHVFFIRPHLLVFFLSVFC